MFQSRKSLSCTEKESSPGSGSNCKSPTLGSLLGSMEMSMELWTKLSLEIRHGYSNAAWRFMHDGTISWLHGIWFFSHPKDTHGKIKSVMKICNSGIASHTEMGFHPLAFSPPKKNNCSYLVKWKDCWKKECYLPLFKKWSCKITNTCVLKFVTTILQVHNPMIVRGRERMELFPIYSWCTHLQYFKLMISMQTCVLRQQGFFSGHISRSNVEGQAMRQY